MTYAVSDVHGCYDQYMALLEKINFSPDDTLYVLGDVIDWGEDGVKLLQDMIEREIVLPVLGNHEYMAMPALVALSHLRPEPVISAEIIHEHTRCGDVGDRVTLRKFARLEREEKQRLVKYIKSWPAYREITVSGQKFLLLHGGLDNCTSKSELSRCKAADLVFGPHHYEKRYFEDTTILLGHVTTDNFGTAHTGRIYRQNGNIVLDCGACFDFGRLGALCLETDEEFYV